jgi:hypothetical protein
VENNPSIAAWKSVGANMRDRLHMEINAKLEQEEIPHAQEDVFKWRMDQAFRNAVKAGEVSLARTSCDTG